MNFVSKFDSSLPFTGTHPKAQTHVDTVHTKAPADAILVSDADLLFNGDFKRSGIDLVISRDDRELVLSDYFKGDKRAPLASSDGAYLTGKIIDALTGYVQTAQADGNAASAKVIGHVTKLNGNATVIRNGVSVILNNGDTVYQGDVVQSGSNSTLGITFIDGSVFGLGSNAKMVLNEMIYDPNGSNNSSLLSLVQGTISFVAGATAKHGDMKVDTPVATMGIRGTAVLVEIDFEVPASGGAPPARFQVLVEPDGTTGSYVLLDRVTLAPIATVNQAGTVTTVSGTGTVSFLASAQLSPEVMNLITEVFSQKFSDTNPQSNTRFTDTVVPETTFPVKFASGETGTATVRVVVVNDNTGGSSSAPPKSPDHIPGPPEVVTFNGALAERTVLTGSSLVDNASGAVSYADVNLGDVPTVSAAFHHFAYGNAAGQNVTSALTAAQLDAIAAVSVPLAIEQDPNGKNVGTATWTYSVQDHALDFLAEGETLTLTYMARVDNNFALNNEFAFAPFTVTITGGNDAPTIAGPAQIGAITELSGTVDSNTPDTATGSVEFEDVDLTDTHTVSITGVSATGTVSGLPGTGNTVLNWLSLGAFVDSTDGVTGSRAWSFSAADYYFDYLAEEETVTFTYTVEVEDNNGATVTQDVVVTVTGTNDAPELAADMSGDDGLHAILEQAGTTGDDETDDTASGSLSFRDVDLSDTHSVNVSGPGFSWQNSYNFTLTASQIQELTAASTFTPTLHDSTGTGHGSIDFSYSALDYYFDFLAEDETLTITYDVTVLDEHNVASTQAVTITVTGTNDVPVAVVDVDSNHIVEAGQDANNSAVLGVAITTGNVLTNDTDVDLTDTHAVISVAAGTVSSEVTGLEATQIAGTYGTLTIAADGSWTYTLDNDDPETDALAQGEHASDVFSYTQSDGHGGTSTATLTINITGTNDQPVANAEPVAVNDEGFPVSEQGVYPGNDAFPGVDTAMGNVLTNDSDVDNLDTKTVQSITNAATGNLPVAVGQAGTPIVGTYGTLTIFADGSWTYLLDNNSAATQALTQGQQDTDVFTYTMRDTLGSTSSATLTIDVTGTNDVPTVVAALTDTAAEGDAVFTQNLLEGASDVDDGAILSVANVTYSVDGGGSSGTAPAGVSLTDHTLNIDPADPAFDHLAVGDSTTITVSYDVTDAQGATVPQTETVTITGTNDLPTVEEALTATVNEGETVFSRNLLAGASDVDDGETATLSIDNVTYSVDGDTASPLPPAGVSLAGQTLTVDPTNAAFDHLAEGDETVIVVSYEVKDEHGATVLQTETVTIKGTNDAPVIASNGGDESASISVDENTTAVTIVQANDVDDGWSLTYSILTGQDSPDAGLFTINAETGELSFVSAPNYEAPGSAEGSNVYTVQVQVADGNGGFDVQTLTVTVTDVGETLQANADAVSALPGTPITLSMLTANDTNSGASAPQIVSVYDAKHGTVALNNGVPVFTPEPGFVGQASFSYWISETANPTPPGTFNAAVAYGVDAFPQAVTLADINEDGKLDLLTSSYTTNQITFRYGNGDGTFELSSHSLQAGSNPSTPVVVTDFNNDGHVDLAVGNFGTDNISIFYSNGNGGYNAAINYAAGDGPEGLNAADLNGDGNIDLVVSNHNAGTVAVTLNNGNGTFQAPVEYAVGSLPYQAALADLDEDGNLDLVVSNAGSNHVSVLLGNGDGTFDAAADYLTPAGSNDVAIGDLNGDGILDIVSSNGTVSVFIGNGDGTFQPQTSYAAGDRTKGIALADFNEDGYLDVVVANSRDPNISPSEPQTNSVSILFGNGDGTLQAPVTYAAGWDTYDVAVADLNGDGRPDIVAPNEIGGDVSVLVNASPGGALSSATVTVDVAPPVGPVIMTDAFTVMDDMCGDTTTVTGLYITDTDPTAATDTFTLTAQAAFSDGGVTPEQDIGSFAHINANLSEGITYDPGLNPPQTDMVTLVVSDSYGHSDTVNFIFVEAGTGPVTLTGTEEKDVIFGTGYYDTLTGGAKADQFVFTPEDAAGADIITDFALGEDRIDLRAFTELDTSNVEAWLATPGNVVQQGADTVITLDEDNTVTLTNVSAASLSASNFIVSQYQQMLM